MSKAVLIPECNKDVGGMKEEYISPSDKKDGAIGLFSRLLRTSSRVSTLGKRLSSESPTSTEPSISYYGVYIPFEIEKGSDNEPLHVYKNKSDAMELVRQYKSARFKMFRSHQDAVAFALRGAEPTDTHSLHEGHGNSLVGEKPYPFKAPSPQDMVALRKAIEAGLTCTVRDRVWDNPRYLVSSGNTPAIVQEGARYNALHIAAKSMNAEICNLILTTVGNPMFVQTLYGMDTDPESCKEFASILVDRYLNTPDKAMNETPLHFAAKFGAENAVDVLTSFPQCNKTAKNKHGEMPKDVICSRCAPPGAAAAAAAAAAAPRIRRMLQERYYVPVLHADDGSGAPAIGRPFTPAEPPDLNQDPLSPRYEIRAFAGPMEANDAESFRRLWKTPPRSAKPTFRLKEMTKGLETVGRNLAEQMKVDWKEYWPFLDTFTDLRSSEGLSLLENYLKAKYETACSFAYSDSIQSQYLADDFTISKISLGNLSQQSIANTILSPMSELCVAMKTCQLAERSPQWREKESIRQRLGRQPNPKPLIPNGESTPTTNHTVSRLLCIERTCQVFAKRIADALIFSLTAEPEVAGESLKSEAKHLQHTIYTYMDDERFRTIDFALIHSRLAQLVVFKLKQQTEELDDINNLVEFLVKLRCPNDDIFSSDDERKPFTYRTHRVKINHVIDGHVRCLASFICEELTEAVVTKAPAVSETECTEIWEKAAKCRCDWTIEVFERNSKKNASFRKNRSLLSTSPKSESFIKRLTFDHDIGDGKTQQNEVEKPVSVNSPAGDSAPVLYSVDVAKCQVLEAEISDDDSVVSCQSDNEEAYQTASEEPTLDSEEDKEDQMQDASDRAVTEPFIYGEEPTKMDRLVFEAIKDVRISHDTYPNVFRWRHTVALYTSSERDGWSSASADDSVLSLGCGSPRGGCSTPRGGYSTPRGGCSTPRRERHAPVTLQMSNWLRVTGPNSPRSALATKNVGHNVSFGF